jgi:hexosaminidase
MKISAIFVALAVLAMGNAAPCKALVTPQSIPATDLGLVPAPRSVQAFAATYTLPQRVVICARNADEINVAGQMKEFLAARKIQASVEPDEARAVIRLSLEPANEQLQPEGYLLIVNDAGIRITAKTGSGLFYALQTLEQLFSAQPAGSAAIHQVRIEDAPAYHWRSVMLDVSRHYFPPSFLKELIDVAASYKINTFHLHLVDDPAWRIEIRKYPRLTQVGSCGDYDHPLGSMECRYYSQEQIRDLVAYAQKRYVQIVPEIEIPGHSAAALKAYPELACKPVSESVYCPSDKTFQFLEDVLDETMALFPSTYVHTGGDEVDPKEWNSSDQAKAFMQQHGLQNADQLQAWYERRIEAYLAQHGKRMAAWDEVLAGGVPRSTLVFSWRGTNGNIVAALKGNDVVNVQGRLLYFNHYQGPSAWEAYATPRASTLRDVYGASLDLRGLSAEERKHIAGVQCALWTEFVPTTELAWNRIFPRALAFSELSWTAEEGRSWGDFQLRARNQYPRLEARSIPYYIPGPLNLQDTTTEEEHIDVNLTASTPDATMYFTTDGTMPSASSTHWSGPLTLRLQPGQEVLLRVVTVLSDGRTSAPAEAIYTRRPNHLEQHPALFQTAAH